MKITDILKPDFVIPELGAHEKQGVLKELALFLENRQVIQNQENLLKALMDRESLGSTGIGDHIAIPHAKSDEVKNILTLFARSSDGINFDSLDQKPVHFVCLLVAPTHSTGLHLKALARISKLLSNPSLRKAILEAGSAEDIFSVLTQEDAKLG